MDLLRIRRDRAAVAAHLAGGEIAAGLAALLRRWDDPRRPAILLVRDWDIPFAEVYAQDELLATFPDAPVFHAGPLEDLGPGTLLVVVIDEDGEAAYAIPDPTRASNPSSPDARARRRRADRGPLESDRSP